MIKRLSLGGDVPALLGKKAVKHVLAAEKPIPDIQEKNTVHLVNIQSLCSSTYQPRRTFEPQALTELANSIKEQGVLQPILVRRTLNNEQYEIIAGERRWRAAQQAGLSTVPVIIHEVDDKTAMAFALIENIQRQDLAPIDEALALQKLLTEHQLSHEELAQYISKSRSTITNILRLLQLEPEVQMLLNGKKLEVGHAKVLLMLEGEKQLQAASIVMQQSLSVRATEQLVKRLQQDKQVATIESQLNNELEDLKYELSYLLKISLDIKHTKSGNGKIEIKYNNEIELKNLLQLLKNNVSN